MNNRILAVAALTCALAMLNACDSQNVQQNVPETHVETEDASAAASNDSNAQEVTSADDSSDIPSALTTTDQMDQEADLSSDTGTNPPSNTETELPSNTEANLPSDTEAELPSDTEADLPSDTEAEPPSDSGPTLPANKPENDTPQLLTYIDAWDEWHTMEVDPTVGENIYDPNGFNYDDDESGWTTYSTSKEGDRENGTEGKEKNFTCLQGIDVSEHQGVIDWAAVADAGYDFTFIRVGYRGYGKAGNIFADDYAVRNLQEAKDNGLIVGAYFFSQALSEEEAREEAALALEVIEDSGVALDLPLMYDPELIKDDWGRANDITRSQVGLNTAAFRDYVESESEWKADIYSNLPWEHEYFDGETLNQYAIWYADYEKIPQTPYHFTWWQYSNKGSVPGIEGRVDLNLWIRTE